MGPAMVNTNIKTWSVDIREVAIAIKRKGEKIFCQHIVFWIKSENILNSLYPKYENEKSPAE